MDLRTTERQLRALVGKPRTAPLDIRIGTGVEARVDRSGVIAFTLRYKVPGGGQRRVALGVYTGKPADPSSLTPAAAVAKAQGLRAQVRSGMDPALEAQRGEAPATVDALLDRYLADRVPHLGASLAKAQKRDIEVIRAAKIGSLALASVRIADVRKSDLAAFLRREYDQRVKEGLHGAATIASLRSTMRMVFGHAEDQGWLNGNPASGLKAPAGAILTERDRVLTPGESGDLWRFLTAPGCSAKTPGQERKRRALTIIMLTGCRASEVLNRKRGDFDLEASTMTIRDGKTAASNRTVPLSPVALNAVKEVLALIPADPDALLFPTPGARRAGQPITSDCLANEVSAIVEALGHTQPEPWTCHDLRRSIVTWMEGDGVDTAVVRRIVGHVAGDVHSRTYDRSTRMEDMRAAVLAYERHVSSLAAPRGGNVVSINTKEKSA